MLGRKVSLKSPVERAIILQSYWAEVAYVLGAEGEIVGISKGVSQSTYLPDRIRNKTIVGDIYTGINIEAVISLNPDVVITDTGHGKAEEIIKNLENYGIPVVLMFPTTAEDQLKAIEIIGTIFGKVERANELISFLEEKM
ncbi:MAG: ABC transporter substrate-binding protein, partial [Candidatus Korarchaeum sp.]|nr:ABC transporter substrate-binding protein [Candidatus Korarchaeum sp.]